jgi:hypothetical protein
MSVAKNDINTNMGVRKVVFTTRPVLQPMSNAPGATQNYYCLSLDLKGFQIQIDLQAMPAGITFDQLQINQVWWVEKRTTSYRLYLYAGVMDPTTRTIDTTVPLPISQYYSGYYVSSSGGTVSGNLTIASGLTVSGNITTKGSININGNTISGGVTPSGYVLTATSSSGSRFTAPVTSNTVSAFISTNGTAPNSSWGNITSVSLTAGTWLVSAQALVSVVSDFALSPTSASNTGAYVSTSTYSAGGSPTYANAYMTKVITIATTTTVYLVVYGKSSGTVYYQSQTGSATPNATGITAVRIA